MSETYTHNQPEDEDDEIETTDLGTYHIAVEHYGYPGFIVKAETNGGFLPANEDASFGLVSPLDAEWSGPSYFCEEQLVDEILIKWGSAAGYCGCEVQKLNELAAGKEPRTTPYECQPAPKLKTLTLIRPDGERVLLYDAEAEGDA